jgi:phosphinothricin acetyltransferase
MAAKGTQPASIAVRDARRTDLPAITGIYRPAVLTGTASFEFEAPDVEEMTRRYLAITASGFPYLVAEADGAVQGYAYVSSYRTRPAYRFSVENSVYVAPRTQRGGVGRALLAELITRSTAQGFRLMIAVIGDPPNQAASIGLHRAMGFAYAGTIRAVGFKFGRWLDSEIMQLPLGPGATTLPD